MIGVALAHGCARPAPIVEDAHATTPVAFTETIPGTTVSFEMIPVPGDGGDIKPFWIARTEGTWDQYDLFVYGEDPVVVAAGAVDAITRPSKPYLPPDRGYGHAGYPAISMSFHGADEFCRWLSMKTGRAYRLPTVQEWSHACRLGGELEDGTDDAQLLEQRAWFAGNAAGTTHAVGAKTANALGAHDMLGNAGEWCVNDDGRPIVCGGSFQSRANALGCAARLPPSAAWNASDPQLPKSRWWLADAPFVGFRVVCENATPQIGQVEQGIRR